MKRSSRAPRGLHKPGPSDRRVALAVEPLEDRFVPSTLAGAHFVEAAVAHHAAAHRFVGAFHHRHAPSHHQAAPAASGTIKAAQDTSLQVQWTFPGANASLVGGPGFIAIGFNQPLNWNTVNGANIQLAHQRPDGGWDLVPSGVWPNPGNGSVDLVPFAPQSNGVYAVAVYTGLHSATGASLSAPYFTTYSIDNRFYAPGSPNTVTVLAPANGEQVGLFPGVITADEYTPLDRASVNTSTVQLFAINADGSQTLLPATVHYDPETPTIELVPTVPLNRGSYRFVINGIRDVAGDPQVQPFSSTFTVNQSPTLYPDTLPGQAIDVADVYPHEGQLPSVTSVSTVTFTQNADPSTINTNTIQLVRWISGQGWSAPLPMTVTYNAALHTAYLVSDQGLPQGYYLTVVNPHPGASGIIGQNGIAMASTEYFHHEFLLPNPPLDGRTFAPFPANAATASGDPPAVLVFLSRYAGEQPSSINTNTVQLRPWLGDHMGNPLPIAVAYNPWPGNVVITPFVALGDGPYVVLVNGLVDIVGNPEQYGFSSWFAITNTGRPQTQS